MGAAGLAFLGAVEAVLGVEFKGFKARTGVERGDVVIGNAGGRGGVKVTGKVWAGAGGIFNCPIMMKKRVATPIKIRASFLLLSNLIGISNDRRGLVRINKESG